MKEGPLETFKTFRKRKTRILNSLIESKTVERGSLLLWNAFLFLIRGFGCVQNQVLSTYRKSAPGTKGGLKKTSHCNSRTLFLFLHSFFQSENPVFILATITMLQINCRIKSTKREHKIKKHEF